jgi:hypothetical protein
MGSRFENTMVSRLENLLGSRLALLYLLNCSTQAQGEDHPENL